MQILSNFFTGTENLFKLLFINGLLMILVGLLYPLQKSDKLDMEIVEYNSSICLLNKDISILKQECKTAYFKVANDSVDRVNIEQKILNSKNANEISILKLKIKKIKKDTEQTSLLIEKKVLDQERKVIEKQNNRKKIEHLQLQQKVYNNYCKGFLGFGIFISTIGLIGWSILTYFTYFKEYTEYKSLNATNNQPSRKKVITTLVLLIVFAIILACFVIFF